MVPVENLMTMPSIGDATAEKQASDSETDGSFARVMDAESWMDESRKRVAIDVPNLAATAPIEEDPEAQFEEQEGLIDGQRAIEMPENTPDVSVAMAQEYGQEPGGVLAPAKTPMLDSTLDTDRLSAAAGAEGTRQATLNDALWPLEKQPAGLGIGAKREDSISAKPTLSTTVSEGTAQVAPKSGSVQAVSVETPEISVAVAQSATDKLDVSNPDRPQEKVRQPIVHGFSAGDLATNQVRTSDKNQAPQAVVGRPETALPTQSQYAGPGPSPFSYGAPELHPARDRRIEAVRAEPQAQPVSPVTQDTRTLAAITSRSMAPQAILTQTSIQLSELDTPLDQPLRQDLVGLTPTSPTTVSLGNVVVAQNLQGYAPQAAHQIARALVQSNGTTTEISLNPEELGRVRIALTTSEAGLSVNILTERPETADLLRRNLEALAREFSELGYDNLAFEFGDEQQDTSEDTDAEGTLVTLADAEVDSANPAMHAPLVGSSIGLDLKL